MSDSRQEYFLKTGLIKDAQRMNKNEDFLEIFGNSLCLDINLNKSRLYLSKKSNIISVSIVFK